MSPGFLARMWDRVRESLWFIPGLMALASCVVAAAVPTIDRVLGGEWVDAVPLLFSGTPDGARAVLSTIATSTITVAGVVFSMTIVALQLASSQFGPRLLRTFMRDRSTQMVLGVYISGFLYCVLIMPGINTGGDEAFVPNIAVTLAIVYAVIELALLVYFIHHVARSIQADAVIGAVSAELASVTDALFPEDAGEPAGDVNGAAFVEGEPRIVVRAVSSGYVRFVDADELVALASEIDGKVRMEVGPGDFARVGTPLASMWASGELVEAIGDRVRGVIFLGANRTALQDVTFVFGQLAEMAMRALSPGINDPQTAVHCVDRIGAGLGRIASRPMPAAVRADDDGVPRLHADPLSLETLLASTVDPIARCAAPHLHVLMQLFDGLTHVASVARREADRAAVVAATERIAERAVGDWVRGEDAERVREGAGAVRRAAGD